MQQQRADEQPVESHPQHHRKEQPGDGELVAVVSAFGSCKGPTAIKLTSSLISSSFTVLLILVMSLHTTGGDRFGDDLVSEVVGQRIVM